ncbi:hypothetical protein SHLI107390_04035 [Shewanella livingstonensis]
MAGTGYISDICKSVTNEVKARSFPIENYAFFIIFRLESSGFAKADL